MCDLLDGKMDAKKIKNKKPKPKQNQYVREQYCPLLGLLVSQLLDGLPLGQ